MDWTQVDWSDPNAKISTYFSVHEATYLPSWDTHHQPSDEEKGTLCSTAQWMDGIRERLGKPVRVHVWIRPGSATCPGSEHDGQDYNAHVGGASHSAHKTGHAVDFDCGEDCDDTRATLLPELEDRGLRMEDKPGSGWVHLDDAALPNGGHRFFKP